MFSTQPQPHHLSVILHSPDHRCPTPAIILHLSTTSKRPNLLSVSCSSHHHDEIHPNPEHTPTTTPPNEDLILRKHNAKSTALLHHLPLHQNPQSERDEKLLQLSMARTRTPQFPGSIYAQSPSDIDVTTSLPSLKTLFHEKDEDYEMLVKAVEIRRNVTQEIFMEAMRENGKFGITYSTNLASRLPEFIDFVIIQAASMKQSPEFSNSSFNVRAKTFLDNSNVVPIIRWLKHNGLSYPQIGKLICMARGNFESIRSMAEWLKAVHVDGRFIGVALLRAGKNILGRSTEELDEIVGYLETNGVRREWIGYVFGRCPELLSFSMEELKVRSNFYFDMGMNVNDFGTMVFDYPKVLGFYSLEEMNQKVAYLKEFGISNEDIGRLLAFKPQLMGCSIEDRWKPLVKYLYYLGISRDGMRRILTVKPMVFCVDLESNIVQKVQFLLDVGVQDNAVGSMLVKFPPLLTYSLYKKIRPVIIFLLTKAGVSQRDIGKVIALAPELLGCSISKKLDPNVKYFLSLGIKLQVLGEMIADFPMLLRYNIDILRPKYLYLRRTMVRPLNDLIEFPRFFSYSLEERIVPRHKILVKNRINFKLRYMLSSTDEEFSQRVQAAVQRRQRFESGITDDDRASEFQTGHFEEEKVADYDENDYFSSISTPIELSSTDEEFSQGVQAAVQRRQRFESGITDDDRASDFETGHSEEDEEEEKVADYDENDYFSSISTPIEQKTDSFGSACPQS